MNMPEPLLSVDFEVFGKVQGVFFTKYLKEMSEHLGLNGWCKNTKQGTICGKIQGPKTGIDHMVVWLTTTGSPGSQIERCNLTNWQTLAKPELKGFSIRF
ncbi:hypothetical protein HHI36_008784 [Cryptolaemus montrouzieri]|uniref:acylphosphatase n=1 Tax=Cryptolaemus montrouzieri TaxID=559131 RepID=A0ABD2MTF8_9CUCU